MKNYKKINWKGVSVEELHPTAHWPPTFLFCALLTRFLLSLRSQPPFHSPFRHSIKAQPTHSQPSSTLAFCLPLISFVLFQCPPVPRYIFCRCVDFFRFHLPGIIFIFFCFSWKPLAMNVWRQEKINEKENEPSGSNAKKNWRNFNPTVLVFTVFPHSCLLSRILLRLESEKFTLFQGSKYWAMFAVFVENFCFVDIRGFDMKLKLLSICDARQWPAITNHYDQFE